MSRLQSLQVATARPLPVLILADVSGSMGEDGKIQALNRALQDMLHSFTEEQDLRAEVQIAIITFGGDAARLALPLTAARRAQIQDLAPAGRTPMGSAFALAADLLADRAQIPSRAYSPTLILCSDGVPTDDWRTPLARLLGEERARKAQRLALAIGADDDQVLRAFIADDQQPVVQANQARKIGEFFRLVTMTVLSRSRAVNPDAAVATPQRFDLGADDL